MLLVQSDLIRSLCFVIFPIVYYIRGPIASKSAFCQASGFFFAVGIESSDISVLLIALHSALYIYRPKSGLYPYRWWAYGAYIFVPVLFASLAFIDGVRYKNVGYICYLPNGKGWAHLALSWIPRHVLFAIIIITYACIYLYVRARIIDYERRDSTAQIAGQPPKPRPRLHSLTQITTHGFVHTVSVLRRSSKTAHKEHVSFADNTHSGRDADDSPVRSPIIWKVPNFGEPSSSALEGSPPDDRGPGGPSNFPSLDLPPPTVPPPGRRSTPFDVSSTSTIGSWKQAAATNAEIRPQPNRSISSGTIPPIFPVCHKLPPPSPVRPPLPTYLSTTHITSHASLHRHKIRRQLRSLVVYPLLYLLIWIFPLVNESYGYDSLSTRPSWIPVMSLVSLAVQGAADSAVFTAREKPWRHTAGEGFWGCMKGGWRVAGRGEAGRTREEFMVDVRIARARREGERRAEEERVGLEVERAKVGGRRHWWEFRGFAEEEEEEVRS